MAAIAAVELLAERLGYRFRDPALLELALTHRSFCAEHPGHESNERLEFLGDAVLGLVVTDHIFSAYPDMPEGELAKLRASVVSAAVLAELAAELELGDAVRLGKGEAASGGARKPSILADAFEAVLGAVYLDGGMEAVRPLVRRLLAAPIVEAAAGPGGRDFKTQLQELAARLFEELPAYSLRGEGPDHQKHFYATVRLGGQLRGVGEGRSKKQAEQAAARAAWAHLIQEFGEGAAPGRTTDHTVRRGRGAVDAPDPAGEPRESGQAPRNPAGSESVDA